MEEKVLIKSEKYNVKKMFKFFTIIGTIVTVILFLFSIINNINSYDSTYEIYSLHQQQGYCYDEDSDYRCWDCREIFDTPTKLGYATERTFGYSGCFLYFIPVVAFTLIGGLLYLWLRSYELTVTDKRIYGKVAWGKRVDLPVDSISATATIRMFKGVSVSTSSGRISFRVIKNADEIYTIMNNLLIERQQEKTNATVVTAAPQTDEADQLKKFKDLLVNGVITQEEFDAKKKQLLGL